ncbi:CysS/YqeB C-terminal domain-containing protein [Streptosporangium roseum]|uniref:CysS/YqeB C-terminal domain-containing protein n=1 Tax=Streptosporangium roseum TaxID=2001 RepID=UPI003321002F
MQDRPGVLVLMGSGETSPTMVEVHRSVVRRLGDRPRAVLLDTPYAFQENAADISSRARRYFARSVGLDVEVGTAIAGADWVFSGPGSPTFALDRWTATPVAAELRGRVRARDGATVLASAAACTAGIAAVPVYEIYKVGAEPHWREGLDLLGALGLRVAVIPHYDNAEGGTHDTRYCYLGERRLAFLERLLPPDAAVLGVDEHTAVVLDLRAESLQVAGRGGLTVRRPGSQTVLPAGTVAGLAELRRLVRDGGGSPGASPGPVAPPEAGHVTLGELTRACEQRFGAALGEHDTAEATRAVLDLEAEITKWAADTEEDEGGVDEAREILRHLVTRLGRLADTSEPRDRLAPLVEPLLALRERLREQGVYDSADALREALAAGGVSIEDGPDGPRWTVRG